MWKPVPDFVYLNDKVVPASEAKVSVFDHGFLYGDGIFETMRAFGTKIHLVEAHLNRLIKSAEIMKLSLPWTKEELYGALKEVLEANNLENSAVRLTVSRGTGLPLPDPAYCERPTLVITCRPAPELKGAAYERGVEVALLKTRRNNKEAFPLHIKSCNFLNNIFAKLEVKDLGVYEGLMLNHEGWLTEGTVNNVFFVKKGTLFTPALDCGLLDGVTRSFVIKLAGEAGIDVVEGFFGDAFLMEAEELFLTNSVSLIVPVNKIGGKKFAAPGAITRALSDAILGSTVI